MNLPTHKSCMKILIWRLCNAEVHSTSQDGHFSSLSQVWTVWRDLRLQLDDKYSFSMFIRYKFREGRLPRKSCLSSCRIHFGYPEEKWRERDELGWAIHETVWIKVWISNSFFLIRRWSRLQFLPFRRLYGIHFVHCIVYSVYSKPAMANVGTSTAKRGRAENDCQRTSLRCSLQHGF